MSAGTYEGTKVEKCRSILSSTWYDIQASFKPWVAAIIVSSAHFSADTDTRFCQDKILKGREQIFNESDDMHPAKTLHDTHSSGIW
jgi:hypothetical protein